MKLENVDIEKIKLTDFPAFTCLCELCDDGCFDRAGNEHHPNCKRQHAIHSIQIKRLRNSKCPLSHYKETFRSYGDDVRRRSPYHPPPDPVSVTYQQPMDLLSSQRDHYKPPTVTKRVEPIKQVDKYVKNDEPMQTQSHYQVEFIEKPIIKPTMQLLKDPVKDSNVSVSVPFAKFSSQTTARSHFQPWKSAPSHAYGEPPAVAGHILFPGVDRSFETSSGVTFIPFPDLPTTKSITKNEYGGNLKVPFGSMDLTTNYRKDYIEHEITKSDIATNSRSSIELQPKRSSSVIYVRHPMNSITQTKSDYRPYPNHRPPHPAEMEPFQSQITIGGRTSEPSLSQYRQDYPGHDMKENRPVFTRKDAPTYKPPTEKMETVTITQRDYQPLDLSSVPRLRVVPLKPTLTSEVGPMESVTTSRHHFKPYQSTQPRRYGDPAPSFYIPPVGKIQSTTTNSEHYQARPGERARNYKPEIQILNRVGAQDFNTMYRADFKPHGVNLCGAKAYTLAQKLQQQLDEQQRQMQSVK
ncbi:unnamed protein product [Didymodactylos carnosus]|uniref:Uncharacterized protein n=1 Tax=Didymodactylos carnosus TaxID=1234261 RepID=A0A814JNN1_9BILA|nr:unnamed protein product [Didymodactylos carnosus]CAF1040154.1 unnamed protein product [Didymodactylos carnosus]CAF3803993.1 unnamed protein product [Didymodactylos carnosus]CAF3810428.1 unnamed protein product [Didymodactylos carnosus]